MSALQRRAVAQPLGATIQQRRLSGRSATLALVGEPVIVRHHYMSVTSPAPLTIVRVPYPMPRWRSVIKAMTPVMHFFGYRAKDMHSLDGLLPYPDDDAEWDSSHRDFAARLACAYGGDPTCLPKFNLFDWQNGEFVLVRKAVT